MTLSLKTAMPTPHNSPPTSISPTGKQQIKTPQNAAFLFALGKASGHGFDGLG
jgi:hypothetical protein